MAGEAAPVANLRLGRYVVLKHLATGGMAEVLLALDEQTNRYVVIKRIRREQAQDTRFIRMFFDEAQLAASLHHPNIVRVFELGEQSGDYFFAMEYVHGEDLRRVLMEVHRRRDKVPIALITSIVAAAAAGLHHAHQQRGPDGKPLGIVHRDVSPANILVGYDGIVKVADFGIAKAMLRSVETQSGTLKGKVSYMSPEQVTGRAIDHRSDVFALGIVLYEVATARRLFKGDNDFLTMSAVVHGQIPFPSVHRADLPRILEDIIMRALATKPGDRYQSAEELHGDLEKFTLAIGMKMSPGMVADYMKNLFGSRPAPWLAEAEVTVTGSINFDGGEPGLVPPPEMAVIQHELPREMKPAAASLIAHAHAAETGAPVAGLAPLTSAKDDWNAGQPPTGSGTPVAWTVEPTSLRPRRRYGIVLGTVATLAVAGTIFAVRSMGGDGSGGTNKQPAVAPAPARSSAADEEAAARPNPAPPAPANVPEPATEPAATAPAVTEPAPPPEPVATKPAETARPAPTPTPPVVVKQEAPEPATVRAKPAARPRPPKPPVVADQARPTPPKPTKVPKPATKPTTKPATASNPWNPDELFPK